jgi:hypothetical protein
VAIEAQQEFGIVGRPMAEWTARWVYKTTATTWHLVIPHAASDIPTSFSTWREEPVGAHVAHG